MATSRAKVRSLKLATSEAKEISLKLFIDTKGKKVVFAEAGKDFVDFLFYLLHLPVGTVVKLLTKQAKLGSLDNLYDSIENLSQTYFQSTKSKQSILNLTTPISSSDANPSLLLDGTTTVIPKMLYTCSYYASSSHPKPYVSADSSALCPQCNCSMYTPVGCVRERVEAVELAEGERGFVKGVVTYMVMDDLSVTPMSCSTLLDNLNIKEICSLEQRIVDLGMPEGLKLLKASLHSETVLTNVYLEDTAA